MGLASLHIDRNLFANSTLSARLLTSADGQMGYSRDVPEPEKQSRANSRKGIPNGKSKHYGNRDERHKLDMDAEDAIGRLVYEPRSATGDAS